MYGIVLYYVCVCVQAGVNALACLRNPAHVQVLVVMSLLPSLSMMMLHLMGWRCVVCMVWCVVGSKRGVQVHRSEVDQEQHCVCLRPAVVECTRRLLISLFGFVQYPDR